MLVSQKYLPRWSLPAKVLVVGDKQLEVVEYITGQRRKAAVSQCRMLSCEVPDGLREINWQHMTHSLPARWHPNFKFNIPPPFDKSTVQEKDPGADSKVTEDERQAKEMVIGDDRKRRRQEES
eukprot:GHVQ01030197.1.p1 GENE.GHVQ01030197.1~~GHVQ01030197.1.p1  ORF type:complete len:123 (+),score=19.13 GHVQ01030197.1:1052-1420(+)